MQFYVHNIEQLPPIEAIKELMNFSNDFVNLQLMKFVLSCFDLGGASGLYFCVKVFSFQQTNWGHYIIKY